MSDVIVQIVSTNFDEGETSEIYANNRDQRKSCGFAYAFDPQLIW